MSLTKEEVVKIAVDAATQAAQQVAQQIAQEVAQQQAKQIEQAVSQGIQAEKQGIQGSTQEKVSFVENKAEETNTGEAHRGKTYVDAEMWGLNKKLITEREQKAAQISQDYDLSLKSLELKEKELAVAEREAKLRHQVKLDSIEVSEKENNALVRHLANTLVVDFRTAAYHPISPNDGDERSAEAKISRK